MAIIEMIIVVFVLVAIQKWIFTRFWKHGLSIQVSFSTDTAVEEDTIILKEILTNRKLLPLPWIAVKFQVSKHLLFTDNKNFQISDDYYRNDVFSIMMHQRITRSLPFVCGKRGLYNIKSIDLVSNDILFTSKLYCPEQSRAMLTVYPRLVNIDDFTVPHKKISGNILARRFINPDPFEFKGIREYQSYDSFKTINFKASAKTGRYMVNMFDYTVSQEIIILLNLQKYSSWVDFHLFEQCIRLAASLAAHYVGEGIPVSIISGGQDVISGQPINIKAGQSINHLKTINEALARIDLDRDVAPIKDYSQVFDGSYSQNQVFILISTYNEPDLEAEFKRLCQIGSDGLWIIPALYDTKIMVDIEQASGKIVKWKAD